jgi:hypothetical protein
MQTAVDGRILYPAFFVEMEIASGFVRLWSGLGTYEWPISSPPGSGKMWTGVGSLGEISEMGETTDTNAMGLKLSLSGIPADMVTAALDELIPGKSAKVSFGLFEYSGSPQTFNLVEDPYDSFPGRIDAVDMEEGGATCRIDVAVESRMIDLQVSTEWRWTSQSQKVDWPNDTGFDGVESLQEYNDNWGIADQPLPQIQN